MSSSCNESTKVSFFLSYGIFLYFPLSFFLYLFLSFFLSFLRYISFFLSFLRYISFFLSFFIFFSSFLSYLDRGRPSLVPPLHPVQVPAYFQNTSERNMFLDICQDVLQLCLLYCAMVTDGNGGAGQDEALFASVLEDCVASTVTATATASSTSTLMSTSTLTSKPIESERHQEDTTFSFPRMIRSCRQSPPDKTKVEHALLYVRILQLTVQYKLWNESPLSLLPSSMRQELFELDITAAADRDSSVHNQHFRDIRRRELWPEVEHDETESQLLWILDLLQHDVSGALFFAETFGLPLDRVRQEQVDHRHSYASREGWRWGLGGMKYNVVEGSIVW